LEFREIPRNFRQFRTEYGINESKKKQTDFVDTIGVRGGEKERIRGKGHICMWKEGLRGVEKDTEK